jgi:ABC-2 type transport system permease protein
METLRRSWRGTLGWGLGMFLLGLLITMLVQDADMLNRLTELTQSLPPALLRMIGASEDVLAMATPEGFIGTAFFGRSVLILAVYAILAGLNITSNEEDQGILDVVFSLPLPRWRFIIEKFAAYSLLTVVVLALSFIGLVLGAQTTAINVDTAKLLAGCVNLLPGTWLMIAFTGLAGAIFPRRGTAVAVTAVFVIGSYLLNFLGQMASESIFSSLSQLSFFRYYESGDVILNGLSWSSVGLLLAVTVALVGMSLWFFQRRDIGV